MCWYSDDSASCFEDTIFLQLVSHCMAALLWNISFTDFTYQVRTLLLGDVIMVEV